MAPAGFTTPLLASVEKPQFCNFLIEPRRKLIIDRFKLFMHIFDIAYIDKLTKIIKIKEIYHGTT